MAPRDLSELEALLGHRFARPVLLTEALTHGSVRHEHQAATPASTPEAAPADEIRDNERLEFLGDAIVGMVVAELLYRRYPELDEGELTRLRAALVSRKHLGLVGLDMGLGVYLRLGKAEERSGGRGKAVLLANCVEALIAALYLEAGLAATASFIERRIAQPYVADLYGKLREHRAIGDYKSALQELLQSRGTDQPEYRVEAESGPDHRKRFLVSVGVPSNGSTSTVDATARAESTTKKKAEQEAARQLYERLSASHDQASVRPAALPTRPSLVTSAATQPEHPTELDSQPAPPAGPVARRSRSASSTAARSNAKRRTAEPGLAEPEIADKEKRG